MSVSAGLVYVFKEREIFVVCPRIFSSWSVPEYFYQGFRAWPTDEHGWSSDTRHGSHIHASLLAPSIHPDKKDNLRQRKNRLSDCSLSESDELKRLAVICVLDVAYRPPSMELHNPRPINVVCPLLLPVRRGHRLNASAPGRGHNPGCPAGNRS